MKFMKRKIFISLIVLVVLLLSQYKILLTGYANFFTIDDPTHGVNAPILILAGGAATRVPKALELYEKGYGNRLLLTTERSWNSKVAHLFSTNEQMAKRISQELNVQAELEVVPSLKGGATSTFDEAHDLLAFCSKEKIKHLIIVTDSFHTRRALYAFKKVFQGSDIKVEASAAPNEIFSEENWWRSDRGISAYLLEPIKFAVYMVSNKNVSYIKND
jgi:uncharacterized SAM-binding protein YcdF (DUF218 family)